MWLDGWVSILADPRRCPSCRSELPVGAPPVCATCSLDLSGESGMELFSLLTRADELIDRIRARGSHPSPPAWAPGAPSGPLAPTLPGLPNLEPVAAPTARGPRVATVPGILLSLGALCVLVAGALFLPFAWDLLGVVGRTVILLVLTGLAFAGARAAGRRGLRATSESLGAVALGLVGLDVLGADASGWFGALSDAGLATACGAALVLAATAVTVVVRATQVAAHRAGEVVAGLGTALAVVGIAASSPGTPGQRLAAACAAALVVAWASWTLRRPSPGGSMAVALTGQLATAALSWLALVLTGVAGALDDLAVRALWPDGPGLELALAAALAAAPALLPALPHPLRVGALATALVPAIVAVTAPAYDEGAVVRLLLALAVTALASLGRRGFGQWRDLLTPAGVLAAATAMLLLIPLATSALEAATEAASRAWSGRPGGGVSVSWDELLWGPAWLLPLGVLVLGAAGTWCTPAHARSQAGALSGAALALAVGGAALLGGAPVWVTVALLLLVALLSTARALLAASALLAGIAGGLSLGALYIAAYDELLTLLAALALLVVALGTHLRGPDRTRMAAGAAVAPLLATAAWAGGAQVGSPEVWTAVAVLLGCTAVVLARGVLPDRDSILGVELGALAAAVVSVAVGLASADLDQESLWLAGYLTVLGAATTAVALLREDRRRVAWAGGLLLAAASWVRLGDLGVSTVEAYTLPTAMALLGVGVWHTAREPGRSTMSAWSPGLGLALTPSLLWSLEDPISWRALLLASACLALTLTGAQRRWAAPLLWGAAVGAVLALWEVVPPALEASAWAVSGVAGAILLAVGATWDRRLREAREMADYLRRLR